MRLRPLDLPDYAAPPLLLLLPLLVVLMFGACAQQKQGREGGRGGGVEWSGVEGGAQRRQISRRLHRSGPPLQ